MKPAKNVALVAVAKANCQRKYRFAEVAEANTICPLAGIVVAPLVGKAVVVAPVTAPHDVDPSAESCMEMVAVPAPPPAVNKW
jgi:hypothetical protein